MCEKKCNMEWNCYPDKSDKTQEQSSNSQRYIDGRCPLKAYSLNCSEYGSHCLDKECEGKNCRRTRKVFHATVCYPPNSKPNHNSQSAGTCSGCDSCSRRSLSDGKSKTKELSRASSATCCDSCSKDCRCDEGMTGTKQSCCGSYCNGGPCKDNHRSKEQFGCGNSSTSNKVEKQQRTRASCCDSCCEDCTCNDNEKALRRTKKPCCDHSCQDNCLKCRKTSCWDSSTIGSCEDVRSKRTNRRVKFRAVGVVPFRQHGVISNYMGFIPGLQMTFGETYGVTANRLLERHFREQQNRKD